MNIFEKCQAVPSLTGHKCVRATHFPPSCIFNHITISVTVRKLCMFMTTEYKNYTIICQSITFSPYIHTHTQIHIQYIVQKIIPGDVSNHHVNNTVTSIITL
ncbi:hypothetical protein OTU49_015038 [Cherax quadricarinatus]|uniref:Uncharacterized protein n=1 Tax=Cherax quadricarinatus TaxID=27406 RepID=A0AAW0Y4D3_CHEQU